MLRSGILNPQVLSLLAHFRHTNTIVLADRGFPFWPEVETIDLSVVDDLPTVMDLFRPIRAACGIGRIHMATEFEAVNERKVLKTWARECEGIPIQFESHETFKLRVPYAIGIIRTGDTTQYANMILESA